MHTNEVEVVGNNIWFWNVTFESIRVAGAGVLYVSEHGKGQTNKKLVS